MKLSMSSKDLYNKYRQRLQKIADVKNALAVLQWDQETYLPPKGNDFRGRQIATLNEMAHQYLQPKNLAHYCWN